MKKLVLIITLLISCLAVSAQNTPRGYVEKYKDTAVMLMHETGVPASIILGAAMHESANGNSNIAKKLNNHFGIKGGRHNVYYKNNKAVHTAYKRYDSVADSYRDFVRIMTQKKQFRHLCEKLSQYDYVHWAHGIQNSGYCSSRLWGSQVVDIIRIYKLSALDENPEIKGNLAATGQ